jgi:hypothetical protein
VQSVINKVALGQIFFRALPSPLLIVILPMFHTHLPSDIDSISPFQSSVYRNSVKK